MSENEFWKLYTADQMDAAVEEMKRIHPTGTDTDHLSDLPFSPKQVVAFIRDARMRGYNGHPIRFIPAGLRLRDGLERQVSLRKAHCLRSAGFEDRPTLAGQWVLWAPVPMRTKEGAVLKDFDMGKEIKPLARYGRILEAPDSMRVRPGSLTELIYLAVVEHGRTGWPNGRDMTFVSEQLNRGERFGIRAMTDGTRLKLELESWPKDLPSPYPIAPIVASKM